MNKRSIILGLVALLILGAGGGYLGLQAIPPRYVARLPQPLQDLAAPAAGAAILPTVAPASNAASLLQTAELNPQPTATSAAIMAPPTLTPPAVGANATVATVAPSPTSTATPIPTATRPPLPTAVRLDGIAHQFQEWNNCGPATLAMTLSYFDLYLTQSDTASVLKPNPEDRNVSPWEMADYVNNYTDYNALFRVNGRIDTIRQLLNAGIPVILEIGIDPPGEFRWLGWYGHYLLVVAYDDAQQQFWVYDSWFGTSAEPLTNADPDGRILTYAEVDTYWPHFNYNYVAIYRPEQADTLASILGDEMDSDIMWANTLARAQAEATAAPDNAFFWFNLGTAYNARGLYDRAAAAFDQARAIGLPWRMLWYQFGPYEAYYKNGRYEDIILLADTTLKDRPYFEESFYYKGLAQAALGNFRDAQTNLERAAAFNPNYAPAAAALTALENGDLTQTP